MLAALWLLALAAPTPRPLAPQRASRATNIYVHPSMSAAARAHAVKTLMSVSQEVHKKDIEGVSAECTGCIDAQQASIAAHEAHETALGSLESADAELAELRGTLVKEETALNSARAEKEDRESARRLTALPARAQT